jgi:hypothetical protein
MDHITSATVDSTVIHIMIVQERISRAWLVLIDCWFCTSHPSLGVHRNAQLVCIGLTPEWS